jgi:hypothetical protein
MSAHPNTISREPSPPSWEEDVTRPGDPSDLAELASATIPSVVAPLPTAPPPAAVLRAETDRTVVVRVPPRDHKRPMIAIALMAASGGFVAGYLVRGSDGSAAASMSGAPSTSAPRAPVVRAPAIAIAAKPIAPPAAPQAAPATPAAAPPVCHARFTDAPDGATVRWGDLALGVTPFAGDVDVPCGDATVVLTHPRYERLERAASAAADAPAIVDAEMKRPMGTLELRSTPPGASFTIDGAAVDAAAGPAKVHAFTRVTIVAQLPGYSAATERMYVHSLHDSVVVQLAPATRKR